jgi:hypothetical protein
MARYMNVGETNSSTGFENESKTSAAEDKADLLRKVERLLPQEIATFIETRADVVECLTARLRERFRDNQSSDNPEGVSGPAMDPVAQGPSSESDIIPTNEQDSHLDFGKLDFSYMVSESDAYHKGYEAGHEEGYQQGQKDGYQAGKKAAARTQNRVSSQGLYQQEAAIDSMPAFVPQTSVAKPWDLASGVGEGPIDFDDGLFGDLTDNWQEDT